MTGDRVGGAEFQQADGVEDWRVLGGGVSAWFDAPAQSVGAVLVERIGELTEGGGLPRVDLRAGGVRLRIGGVLKGLTAADVALARGVSAAARELGLAADPTGLQMMRLAIDATDRPSVEAFWQNTLGYEPIGADGLGDPLRRDPAISFHQLDEPRPLRNRIHVDIGRGSDAVDAVKAGLGREPYGAYELTFADDEGNEIDLVPGDQLSPETSDWQTNFGAMTFYPTKSPELSTRLVTAVAKLSDDSGEPVLVDVRPDGVTIDSGKDLWEDDEGTARPPFVALAGQIQAAAHDLGLSADTTRLRFVQLGIDAVDIPAVRAFWTTFLGYDHDPRPVLSDIYDPRRLNPVLFFQRLDASDEPRRHQRNRIRVELVVPHDQAQPRINQALSAGGRVLPDQPPGRHLIADPEGNEVSLITQP